jgi:DNA-binding transcriptional LysR family regulator
VRLEWSDLNLFLTVVRAGSLRAAARELALDVSTVSRRITQLEQVSGERLLLREARRLELTPAGTHMFAGAERMANEAATLAQKIKSSDRRLGGLVRITAPGAVLPTIGEAIRELSLAYPNLELELLSLDAPLPIDGAQLDIAVRVAEAPPDHLVGTRVCRVHAAVYASKSYLKRAGAALDDPAHVWVEWDRRVAGKPAFQWLLQRFPQRRMAARGLSTLDVYGLVQAGVGLGALPVVVGDADASLKRLLDVPAELGSSLWLLTHPELRAVPRIRVVMSALRKALVAAKAKI